MKKKIYYILILLFLIGNENLNAQCTGTTITLVLTDPFFPFDESYQFSYDQMINGKCGYLADNSYNFSIGWNSTLSRWEIYSGRTYSVSPNYIFYYSTVNTSSNPPNSSIGNWVAAATSQNPQTMVSLSGTGTTSTVTPTTWNGITWSNSSPSSTIDAIIASSTAPSSFTCKALTINSGVALTTTGITATVNGDITNNGNGIAGTGGLTIAANSTIGGSNINFNGTLTVNSGATLTTAGLLTLTSNATNTGYVGNSAGSIAGNVTVQRYIPSGRRAFRFLAHPFTTNLTLSNLTDNIDITGTGGSPLTTTSSNAPSAFGYDNSIANSSLTNDPGWTPITATSTFNAKTGYRILIRGSKGQTGSLTGGVYTPDAVTIDWVGNLNQGNQTVTLTNNGTNKDYTLVGNPYASPVDLSLVTRGSNINANFSIWNPNLLTKGGYQTLPFSASYILPSGAAFFTQTAANSNNIITFTEASKSTGTPTSVFRNTGTDEVLTLQVNDNNGNYADNLSFILNKNRQNYSANNDVLWDATKMINPEVNLYSFSKDGAKLAIDRRSIIEEPIALGFTAATGNYSFVVKEIPATSSVNYYLKDNYLQTTTLLQAGTTIPVEVTTNATSQGNTRFELVTKQAPIIATDINLNIKLSPNPVKDIVTISGAKMGSKAILTDVSGKVLQQITVTQTSFTINMSKYNKGIYLFKTDEGVTQKIIKE